MQTTVENTDKHTVKLTIEVPAEDFAKDLNRTYRAIANEVKIPGFRKGKAPKPIIDAQVGKEVVLEEFVSSIVPEYFRTAVSEEDLAPIGSPEVDVEQIEPGKPLIFTATVEVRPRLDLEEPDYKGLKVQKPSTDVGDEEVEAWVERLRRQFAELEPAERPSQEGDFVTVNITVERDGQQVDQLTREEYMYSIGSQELGERLDDELKGKKPGDIVTFQDTLPDRFGEDLGGAKVSFRVMVKDVKALHLPEADDAFAKTASEFDSMGELRDDLRDKVREAKEKESQGVIRDRALQALIDSIQIDLPDSLVEEVTTHRVFHAEEQAQRYGLTLEQMLEVQGWDRDRLTEDSRDHAIRAIKADIALEGVARAEKIEVSAEELGAEISALAQAYQRDAKELAKQLNRTGQIVSLAGDIIRTKALDILVEHADIQEGAEGEAHE